MEPKPRFDTSAMYSPRAQQLNQLIALSLILVFVAALKINVGIPPTIIVGASAMVGFVCWRKTNLRRPIEPFKLTILFLVTVAALHIHMYEEHSSLFGPAMSRLFNIVFPDESFLIIFVFVMPVIYYFTAIGLLLRIPLAAFVAWFIFIGPGIAEFTHFIFPLLKPALEPSNPEAISAVINGVNMTGLQNHYIGVTGRYYFPGLITAVLPMIPGIYSVRWLLKKGKE